MLGAWLAVVYALALLATGLASQAAVAHGVLDGATLCSGLAAPGPEAPETPAEASHCKGCPANPAMDAPPFAQQPAIAPLMVPVVLALPAQPGVSLAPACGLPQSRAPPAA